MEQKGIEGTLDYAWNTRVHLPVLVTTAETVKVWYDVAVAYAVETTVVGRCVV
jgi:hypothetical protein